MIVTETGVEQSVVDAWHCLPDLLLSRLGWVIVDNVEAHNGEYLMPHALKGRRVAKGHSKVQGERPHMDVLLRAGLSP